MGKQNTMKDEDKILLRDINALENSLSYWLLEFKRINKKMKNEKTE